MKPHPSRNSLLNGAPIAHVASVNEETIMKMTLAATAILVALAAAPALAQSRPPAQVNLDNQRAALLTALTVSDSEGKVVGQLSRPLAAGKKGVLRLTRAKGCEMSIQARFDDEGEVDETVNLCREKVLRFTE
jgi:hypothetical protein